MLASRPKTLIASIAPVTMASAWAGHLESFHLLSALFCLFSAVFIQVGTNFFNDYADFQKGADTKERVGPTRVTQAGLVSPAEMLTYSIWAFGLAILLGLYLVVRGGWPILVIGVLAVLMGFLYTAGRWSLAYTGLGDFVVLVFFGPVATAGTYYVQSGLISYPLAFLGMAPGLVSVAILTVNNLRDKEQDARVNKRTLAVRFGVVFARNEYKFCLLTALLIPSLVMGFFNAANLLFLLLLLPACMKLFYDLKQAQSPQEMSALLPKTALFYLLHTVCLILWIVLFGPNPSSLL